MGVVNRHVEIVVADNGRDADSLLCGRIIVGLRYGDVDHVSMDFSYLMRDLVSVKVDGKELVLSEEAVAEWAKAGQDA